MGMGTKVQYRNYFPPFDTMRDLNANTGNSWSPFYINKTFNENFYNGLLLSSLNGYSEYDKEMLKRTMLEHEATFRKQVYELHRLYSIQKDLMAKFQKNGSSGSFKYEDMSNTFSYTSQVQSEYSTRMLSISHLHAMHNSQKKEESLYNDDIISPINFFERNRQSSSDFCELEALQKVAEPDDRFRECPKTILALHLPDCGFIDDTERLEEFCSSSSLNKITCSGISNGDSDTELKLNLASGSGPTGDDDVCKLNYHNHNSPFTSSVFVNEPNTHPFVEKASDSFSHQISGLRTQKKENNGLSFSLCSSKLSLQNALSKDWNCGESAFSNVFHGVKKKTSRGKPCPLNFTSSISYKERNSMFCEPIKLNANKPKGISTNQNEESVQFVHEEGNHFQIRNMHLGLPPVFPNSLSSSLNFESISATPNFNGTNNVRNLHSSDSPTIHNATSVRLRVGIDLNSPLRFEADSLPRVSGPNDEFPYQSHSTPQLKFQFTSINLNNEAEIFFSASRNRLITQYKAASGIDGKCVQPSRLPSQVDPGLGDFFEVYDRKTESVTSLSSCNLEVFSSSLDKRECEIKINQLSDSLNGANLTDPNFEQNLASSSKDKKLLVDELRHDKTYSFKNSTSVEIKECNSRKYIDLNSVFPVKDVPDSLDCSTKVQTDSPSNCSGRVSVSRAATLINLEEPIISFPSMSLQAELCSHEMLIKEAAELIVKLSSEDVFKEKDGIHGSQSIMTSSKNGLYLFAEIVLSEENITRLNEPEEGGFDLFELMNLHLEEMKPEKLWRIPQEVENTAADKRSKASILLAKPRRAQGRKRRQRKDFQKDILPALTTLSRQETIKDLQAIGELMKAAGTPWQAGTRRRRKTWRNGAQPQASVSMAPINPPIALSMDDGDDENRGFEVDGHDIIGWGRMTRRCRSQRCHPVSISTTLT